MDWIRRVTHEIEESLGNQGIEMWTSKCRRRIYTWAGHVVRRTDGRWATTVLDWMPPRGHIQGEDGQGRRQERPRRRWEDTLDEYFVGQMTMARGEWRLLAANKLEWMKHADSFAKFGG